MQDKGDELASDALKALHTQGRTSMQEEAAKKADSIAAPEAGYIANAIRKIRSD